MRSLVAIEFITLDGVMQGLGSPEEDTDGGFTHGGWGAPYADGIHRSVGAASAGDTSAYLFGRRTYEKMAAFWPSQPDSNPIAASMNSTPKYVASRTLRTLEWDGSHLLSGDLEEAVRGLKGEGEGDIAVLGSGVLLHQLMALGLVDELMLFVHPLILGTGKRLFRDLPTPQTARLAEVSSTDQGSLCLRYLLGG